MAIVLRLNNTGNKLSLSQTSLNQSPAVSATSSRPRAVSLTDILSAEGVKATETELLFIKRAERKNDRWSGHIAFPGNEDPMTVSIK